MLKHRKFLISEQNSVYFLTIIWLKWVVKLSLMTPVPWRDENNRKHIVPRKVDAHTAEVLHALGTQQLINAFGLCIYIDTVDSEGGVCLSRHKGETDCRPWVKQNLEVASRRWVRERESERVCGIFWEDMLFYALFWLAVTSVNFGHCYLMHRKHCVKKKI